MILKFSLKLARGLRLSTCPFSVYNFYSPNPSLSYHKCNFRNGLKILDKLKGDLVASSKSCHNSPIKCTKHTHTQITTLNNYLQCMLHT